MENLPDQALPVPALQPGRRKPTELFIEVGEDRVLPRLRDLDQETSLVDEHRGVQLLPRDPPALVEGKETVGRGKKRLGHRAYHRRPGPICKPGPNFPLPRAAVIGQDPPIGSERMDG